MVIDDWFGEYKPEPRTGLRMVFGAYGPMDGTEEIGYMTISTYYVTDDGYVLAAFPENEKIMKTRPPYTGVKVEYLLKQLKKSRVVEQ